jgi:hypothetical protein
MMVVLLLSACSGSPPAVPQSPAASPQPAASPVPATRPPTGTPAGTRVPPQPTPPGVLGEVPPDIMAELTAEAAALAGVSLAEVRVLRAEQVTWNDGSLGCPEPDTVYTQALVDGYWVVLEVGEQTYDFRLSETSVPRICPAGQGRPPVDEPSLDY